jgi:DNA-binding IclR family transcriptional regulator
MKLSMHASSAGKVLLAGMTVRELRESFKKPNWKDSHPTPSSIMTVTGTSGEGPQEGVAFDNEEYSLGVHGIATGS